MQSTHHDGPRQDRRDPTRRGAALMVLVMVVVAALSTAVVGATPSPRVQNPTRPKITATTVAPTTTAAPPTTTIAPPTTTTATPEPPSVPAADSMRRAALRIVIETSSDWAQLDLPGVSSGHLVSASQGSSEMLPTSKGVVVRGAAGVRRSVTVDVVSEVPGSAETSWITLQQGGVGWTTATIQNRTTDVYDVLTLATEGGVTVQNQVSTTALMGPTQLAWKRADDQRRVLAFTYPWFGESAATDPLLPDHPAEPWRSWDPDDALRASRRARDNGIDGFVMSWSGAAQDGLALYQTLAAADATGGTATILLETVAAGSAAVAEQWIAEALQQASSPAFQRLDGVPVVFVFDGGRLTNEQWRGITQRLASAGTPVHLVGDVWDGQGGAMTGMYRYNVALESEQDLMTATELTDWNRQISRALRARATLGAGEPGLVVATVQPGWDDRLLRGADRLTVPWNAVETYDATWDAALAGEPDWVVITSWNEWYEGTGIAPSVEYGSTALEATAGWAQRFRG